MHGELTVGEAEQLRKESVWFRGMALGSGKPEGAAWALSYEKRAASLEKIIARKCGGLKAVTDVRPTNA